MSEEKGNQDWQDLGDFLDKQKEKSLVMMREKESIVQHIERLKKAFEAKEQYRTDRIQLAYRNFLSLMVFENKDEDPSYQTILFSLAECLGKAAYDAEAELRNHVSIMRLKDYRD